ncbi:MAG: hypothetical protein JKY18_13540 [Flavobacteriales bacterium]|nr:hypothetical protein [Flavobacteriales bacterium]
MTRLLTLLSSLIFCIACNVQEQEINSELEVPGSIEDTEMDPPGTYPEIIAGSAPELTAIAVPWEQSEIYCSNNASESFYQIRAIDRDGEISYIVFSSSENRKGLSFYFNEFDGMGELMSRRELDNANYSLSDKINLQRKGDYIFYFSSLEDRHARYFSLITGEHGDTVQKVIDWDRHHSESFTSDFTSPSGNKVVTFYDTKLVLRDLTDKSTDTLINQEYSGVWSFGQGSWNDKSTKFYFDNSGGVACIWELDVENKTLNKIVPEHYSDHPFFFVKDSTNYIAYCENHCIKLATILSKN